MIFPDWTVIRAIPSNCWAGLLTGQYDLTGGVIRHAAGSLKGGQIVAHLIPAASSFTNLIPGLDFIPGIIANFQLDGISEKIGTLQQMTQFNGYRLMQLSGQIKTLTDATQQVLSFATGAAILSGLSLAVTSIGFLVVNKKLNSIDGKLKTIQENITAIRYFLELSERAELKSALNDLLKIGEMTNSTHRDRIINDRRQTLMKLNEKYKELLSCANTIETATANEEYYCLTGLAYARCSAELGMFDIARSEIEDIYKFWLKEARRITKELLLSDSPERFLLSDFADDVPISALAAWHDFAYGEKKGYVWIDELRGKTNAWYKINFKVAAGKGVGIQNEKSIVIPTLQKLVSRNQVFEGYISQLKMLKEYEITPSEFENEIAQIPKESAVEGYFILQPKSAICA